MKTKEYLEYKITIKGHITPIKTSKTHIKNTNRFWTVEIENNIGYKASFRVDCLEEFIEHLKMPPLIPTTAIIKHFKKQHGDDYYALKIED